MAYGRVKHSGTKSSRAAQRGAGGKRLGISVRVDREIGTGRYSAIACMRRPLGKANGLSVAHPRRCGKYVYAYNPTPAVKGALHALAKKLR